MLKHFITFYWPGRHMAETATAEVDSWDIDLAKPLAEEQPLRGGNRPYAIQFTTLERGPDDWDPRETARGPMYFLGGRIEDLPDGGGRYVVTNASPRFVQPFRDGDVLMADA